MGTWDEVVLNHQANERAKETETRLKQVRDRLEDAEGLEEWDRLNRLAGEAQSRLEHAERALISTSMLDQLDDAFIEINRVLDIALATPDGAPDLSGARAPREHLADVLAGWPSTVPGRSAQAAREAVKGLRDAAQSAIANVEERLTEATERANELRDGATKSNETLEGLHTEVAALTNTIDQEKLRLDQANQANQALFEQTQAQRASEAQAAEAQRATEFRSVVDKARETFEATNAEFTDQARAEASAANEAAKENVEALARLRDQARELVGVIGRTGMTGGYQQDAVAEEAAANKWRNITIGFAAAAVIVLAIAVFVASYVSTDAAQLISKTLLSAALGGIATYAARQSAHHRANARNARNLELALASLGPYLEPLDEEKKKEVLEVFAYILFAQRPVSPDSKEAIEIGPTNIQTLIEAIQRARAS